MWSKSCLMSTGWKEMSDERVRERVEWCKKSVILIYPWNFYYFRKFNQGISLVILDISLENFPKIHFENYSDFFSKTSRESFFRIFPKKSFRNSCFQISGRNSFRYSCTNFDNTPRSYWKVSPLRINPDFFSKEFV